MGDSVRATLWQLHAELSALATDAWSTALVDAGARLRLASHWQPLLLEPPESSAVRVAHALAMGQPGLLGWCARWPAGLVDPPALRCALTAAPLLAGRTDLCLLVAPAGGAMEDEGALVDGESCARLALAGLDPEIELGLANSAAALAESGDLVPLGKALAAAPAGRRFLLLGMRSDAAAGH
jgi:glycerate 2-kinase